MRELTSHKVNGLNDVIRIRVLDEPGPGNACHIYQVDPFTNTNGIEPCMILFQNGPIAEVGVNGISNEALLAVVEDRLLGFQSGLFACEWNDIALRGVQTAIAALNRRTAERVARGCEGTHQK